MFSLKYVFCLRGLIHMHHYANSNPTTDFVCILIYWGESGRDRKDWEKEVGWWVNSELYSNPHCRAFVLLLSPFIDILAYFRWCFSSFGTRVETVFSHPLEHLEQFLLHSPGRSCFPVSSCKFPTCIRGMWSIVQMMKNIAVKSVICHTKSACTTAFSFDFWELRVFARQMVNIQACVKLSECRFSVKYSAKHVVF